MQEQLQSTSVRKDIRLAGGGFCSIHTSCISFFCSSKNMLSCCKKPPDLPTACDFHLHVGLTYCWEKKWTSRWCGNLNDTSLCLYSQSCWREFLFYWDFTPPTLYVVCCHMKTCYLSLKAYWSWKQFDKKILFFLALSQKQQIEFVQYTFIYSE